MIKIDTCHAHMIDVLDGGANITGTLGGCSSTADSTVSMIELTSIITAGGVIEGVVGRRSRGGDVDFPQERLA